MYSNVTKCTRINSTKCTYVHLCLFHLKPVQHVQYSTWCQNRGCICISSRRRIYRSNPAVSCIHSVIQTRNKILQVEFFYKEEKREDIQGEIQGSSQSSNTVLSTVFPVLPHAIQGKDRIFIRLQEDSSNSARNTSTTRLIPCTQKQGILQQLFPMHPSILHGRIRLQAPDSTPKLPVILPTERAF